MIRGQLLIDGRWCDAADAATLPVTDPCSGEVFAHAAAGSAADIDAAVSAARRAFDGPWPDV